MHFSTGTAARAVAEDAVVASTNGVPDNQQPPDEPCQQLMPVKFYGSRNIRQPSRYRL